MKENLLNTSIDYLKGVGPNMFDTIDDPKTYDDDM